LRSNAVRLKSASVARFSGNAQHGDPEIHLDASAFWRGV
jgi:hypothetical protein